MSAELNISRSGAKRCDGCQRGCVGLRRDAGRDAAKATGRLTRKLALTQAPQRARTPVNVLLDCKP